MNTVVSVYVDQAVYHIDKPYNYLVPEKLKDLAKPGCRVIVPFGRNNPRRTGIIVGFGDPNYSDGVKRIIDVLDETPLLDDNMLKLASYLKEHTYCTFYTAVKAMLPPGVNYKIIASYSVSDFVTEDNINDFSPEYIRIINYIKKYEFGVEKDKLLRNLGLADDKILNKMLHEGVLYRNDLSVRKVADATVKMVKVTDIGRDLSSLKLTVKQKSVLITLNEVECCSVREICYFTGVTPAVLTTLQKKGAIEIFEQEYFRNPYSDNCSLNENEIILTEEQQKSYNDLLSQYETGVGGVSLLFGVTGSGKTQVFLKLCDEVAKQGKGVIVMVPEIALTPQTLKIFRERYGSKVAVFHSAMTQGERLDEWKRVKNGEANVAVGTRSAIFAPVKNLGLIIIDEEQEYTYKSEMSPRYNAKDVARFRANQSKALVVMSSATPSIESFSKAKIGKYKLTKLDKRYGNAVLPKVEIVDMKLEAKNGNSTSISSVLANYIDEALSLGNQAIILLNRRGHNTFVSCPKCGYVVTCENCSISMTYHSANNRLMCHYCGASQYFVDKCPECNYENMRYSGVGTQKAAEEIEKMFPEAKILRMDADSTTTRLDYEKNLSSFQEGKYNILIGTQMVAKGLNFPKVTVVGVLNADNSLYSQDFRSYEKTFSLLTQVIGRSGRGDSAGVAVIQTNDPENSIIEMAATQDYGAFYESEILTRKLRIYPPYCDISVVGFSCFNKQKTFEAANDFMKDIKDFIDNEFADVKVIVLGPASAQISVINKNYRFRLIIKHKNTARFREMVNKLLLQYNNKPISKIVSLTFDTNPYNII